MKRIWNWNLAVIAAIGLSLTAGSAHASVIWTFQQTVSGVVGMFSGSLDLTNANFLGSAPIGPSGLVPIAGIAYNDPGDLSPFVIGYQISGPSSFGTGLGPPAGSATGSVFGIDGSGPQPAVLVPDSYASNDLLSGTLTIAGATFSSLGMAPGNYVYSLVTTNESAGDTITLSIPEVPLPAALPLFAAGLGGLGLLGWRRKKKIAARAA